MKSCFRRAGSSGLLGPRGEDHGGGEAVDAESRDVDLITAVRGKLKRQRDNEDEKLTFYFEGMLENILPTW